ncbi:MAG: TOBE domain-containing protein [Chloroflexi bacterium]|nr:TOBE domain-containing protein [Chloroflexota bacterium]
MEISARNQLKGRVTRINQDNVVSEVTVQVGDNEVVAVITRSSVERLKIVEGADVTVIIKATEVMLAR